MRQCQPFDIVTKYIFISFISLPGKSKWSCVDTRRQASEIIHVTRVYRMNSSDISIVLLDITTQRVFVSKYNTQIKLSLKGNLRKQFILPSYPGVTTLTCSLQILFKHPSGWTKQTICLLTIRDTLQNVVMSRCHFMNIYYKRSIQITLLSDLHIFAR